MTSLHKKIAWESGPLKAVEVSPSAIAISLKGKRKADLEGIANQLKLSSVGTVQEIKSRIEVHLKKTELKYDGLLSSKEDIVFRKNDNQPSFESVVCVDFCMQVRILVAINAKLCS